jgi:hypothetical protein
MKKFINHNSVSATRIAAQAVLCSRLFQFCAFKVQNWEASAEFGGWDAEASARMAARILAAMEVVKAAAEGYAFCTDFEAAVSEMLDESITPTEGLEELMRPVK